MKKTNEHVLLIPIVEDYIAKSRTGKRLQANGKKLSEGTIRNYTNLLKHLLAFDGLQSTPLRIRPFNKLDKAAQNVEKNYWKRFYNNFLNYLYQGGVYDNYAGTLVKIIRSIFKYIEEEKMIPVGPFYNSFYVCKEEIPIITLSRERLQYLITDTAFAENLAQNQRIVKDIFVLGCTVALRFSDLIRIRPLDIVELNGKVYLSVKARKTGTVTRIRLPEYAIAIINTYRKRGQKNIFPSVSLSWFNKCVQRLCESANWTEEVERTRSRRGVSKIILHHARNKPYRFCDSVSSHVMRRTAITTMLMNGVPELVVKKISGHVGDSKSFYRYVDLVQSFMDTEVESHFEKLVSVP